MRRWLAFAVLGLGSLAAALVSCGSETSTGSHPTDASAGEGGADLGDATTGGGDSQGAGTDGGTGDDSTGSSGSSSGGGGDGGSWGDGACVAATGCPSGYHCGRYVDPCSGKAFVCGTPCTGGRVCVNSGSSQSCQAKSCTNRCGIVGVDPCGVPISCGGCASGQACVGNACVPPVTVDASASCSTLTCTPDPSTHLCGNVVDGCGHTLSCSCTAGQSCIGGVCTAAPPECTASTCGQVQNACGSGSVRCAQCPTGTQCTNNTCTTCPAPSCGSYACGTAENQCGQSVNCGSGCGTDGGFCVNHACCTPSTCAEALDAGTVTGCGQVDLGCGVRQSCMACDAGEVCNSNTCGPCVPKTCRDYGDAGCNHAVGCGSSQALDCCAAGTTCMGSICCPPGQTNSNGVCCAPGQVGYSGSCCTPECDPTQPPGAQISCGVTIYCQG